MKRISQVSAISCFAKLNGVAKNMIPFNKPSIVGREFALMEEAIARGQLSGDGYFTGLCNERIAELTGAQAALLTHSCTAALEIAAILCDLEPGDEVIMPSFTFTSTANAVALRAAVPVFVDIDPDTLNIDPTLVEAAITSKTKAIFAVHYAGFPADMDVLSQIAKAHDLLLVEDAAQALGSTYKGRQAGTLGDMATFSFHETKNIISGEGGALVLNDPNLIARAEIIREKGTNRSSFFRGQVDKYTWVDIGSSFLPGELIAAFLYGQLEQEPEIRARRLAQFDKYSEAFAGLENAGHLRCAKAPPHTTGNGHMFYLRLPDRGARDTLIAHLRSCEIFAPFHYIPLHSAPAGLKYGRVNGALPITDHISDTLVRLPIFYSLGDDIDKVISAVHECFQ